MKQAPGALYIGSGKEGATKIEFDAKAALSELEAPAGANSSTTSGFAARVLDAKTPPAPYYYRDADDNGIGAGEAEWHASGDEPGGWVSRGGPDNRPEASNADQTNTDAEWIGDACEAPVVSASLLTDPALTGASVQGASQPNGVRFIRAGAKKFARAEFSK